MCKVLRPSIGLTLDEAASSVLVAQNQEVKNFLLLAEKKYESTHAIVEALRKRFGSSVEDRGFDLFDAFRGYQRDDKVSIREFAISWHNKLKMLRSTMTSEFKVADEILGMPGGMPR